MMKLLKKPISLVAISVIILGCDASKDGKPGGDLAGNSNGSHNDKSNPPGMVWIPGGEFTMGTDDPESYQYERPAHRVRVDGFWMDVTEVTNADFKKFVDATAYATTAEKKPEWDDLKKQLPPGAPKPAESILVAGSLVFSPPAYTISLDDYSQWWSWRNGTDWKHPEGPGSSIEGKDNFPVVHISYDDALAYSKWVGKRLPTEAEWEFASRGGREGQRFSWGNEFNPGGRFMANTFQGVFPSTNSGDDGFVGNAPIKSFPPNDYGLYDMIGNCWEWTSDYYNVNYYDELARKGLAINPTGSSKPYDPNEPYAVKHVTRGGSFLCAENYCVNYRPSARQGSAFDSGMSHIGFRCVATPDMAK
ncbi:MAG TPA: formylglycine-generating enzyme family protein [Chryseolinea sp.]|nr:formylglycine-generating enzyme family protein [Chryseolinea sp.]